MTTTKPELKACPFCGSEARYFETKDTGGFSISRFAGCFYTHDHKYGCNISFFGKSKEEAISRWNARPTATGENLEDTGYHLNNTVSPGRVTRPLGQPSDAGIQPPIDNNHVAEGCEKFSHEPVINDAGLAEAVRWLKEMSGRHAIYCPARKETKYEVYYEDDDCEFNCVKNKETLINHAVKGEKAAEVSAEDFTNELMHYRQFIHGAYISPAEYILKKYPAGIKILDGVSS